MSTLKVEITTVDAVHVHPNADKLEIVQVKGWMCVVGKDQYKTGDKCVYIPIDSILPMEVEAQIFGIDSKIKLNKSRVKTIKIRKAISQGLVVHPDTLALNALPVGSDVTVQLGITKYEPPAIGNSNTGYGNVKKSLKTNPNFNKYTDIENFKWYDRVFQPGEPVVAHEKIHGTNFRCGWVLAVADTFFKKLKKLFGMLPKYEFVYGSRNVQLQNRIFWNGYYDTNVYSKIVDQYNLREVLKPGQVIYGEVYGVGIQGGYTYGCAEGEHKLAIFDLMVDGKYQDYSQLDEFLKETNLPRVPVLYEGPYDLALIKPLIDGDSVLAPTQKVREGLVLRPIQEQVCIAGRKILKLISDEYLLGDQTEFH